MMPKYPIYIPSKGRWDSRLTSKALEDIRVPYYIVVEEQQAEQYRAVVNSSLCTVLVLDPEYQRTYDACCDLADDVSRGSGPARNFAWDHARSLGHERHWCVDDNINGFVRWNHNRRIRVLDASSICSMEDFTDRFLNIAMSGPAERYLLGSLYDVAPFRINTRIYSCNLIRTDIPFRWRGRWNEDTILSLDMLKAGWCTALFHAILQNKTSTTHKMKGGNTDVLYANGTLEKSQMLVREHPDVSRVVWKFGRHHHHVDYRPFKKNRLVRKSGIVIPEGVNNYGMKLVHLQDSATLAKVAG